VGLVIGSSGCGKTLLCQLLAREFRSRLAVVLLTSSHPTSRRALLQAILFELGLPYRGLREGELRLALIDHLSNTARYPAGMLLLIDEAHTLPLKLLEEVRLITNVAVDGQPRVRLVLAGNRSLEERFASPRLESFSQRVAARTYLEPFDRDETREFVRAQLAIAGGGEIFADDALDAVYQATEGVPRLVNQICDHALVLAYAGGKRRITAAGVEESWADLQQLPTPWQETAADRHASGVVEFGVLDDEPAATRGEDAGETSLRIASPAAERPTAMSDQWLDSIEDHLSTIDDEFYPAGTIGPEIELNVASTSDPFAENFDEEEVVVDRYAAARSPWGDRPQVSCAEGRMISSFLEPLESTAAAGRIRSAYDPVLPEEPNILSSIGARQNIAGRPSAAGAPQDETTTRPMMIVEDDPPAETVQIARRPAAQVRRQEYGQLFARLKRG
jgi:type II secretory pathway predicted ATPase ExeA